MKKDKKSYDIQGYKKSNTLIQSKYRTTTFGNKIIALGLYHLQRGNFYYSENGGNLVCEISAAELKEKMNRSGNSMYRDLQDISKRLMNYHLGYQDDEAQEFEYINLFTKMGYKDGKLTIIFNGDMKSYLSELKDNYTILNLPLMLKWQRNYTFRLYELLSSRTYLYEKDGYECEAEYRLSEFKFMLGIYDINDEKVVKLIKGEKNPNYDEAEELLRSEPPKGEKEKKKFLNWTDFKRFTLMPAVKEINETVEADMQIDAIEPLKQGKGGKVYGLRFKYRVNLQGNGQGEPKKADENNETKQISEDDKFDFEVSLKGDILSKYKLPISDIRAICDVAGYNMDKIKQAALLLEQQKKVDNVTGWLLACIKNGFKTVGHEGSKGKRFNDFESRDYTSEEMEEMEAALLRSNN